VAGAYLHAKFHLDTNVTDRQTGQDRTDNGPVAQCERFYKRWQKCLNKILSFLHCVSKNVPPLTCCNLDIHDPITIIFGTSVTKKVRNYTTLCFPYLVVLHYLAKQET